MDSINELERLEKLSKTLDFSPEEWESAMALCSRFGKDYLAGLKDSPAWFPIQPLSSGRPSPSDSPESLQQVISDFSTLALNSGIEPTSSRFYGYIPGGGMPAAAIGDLIAALTNRYAGVAGVSPGAVEIENQVVRWIRLLLDWPENSWGTLQSGGSMATLTALIAARATRKPEQWSKSVIYCSAEAHHCFDKALLIAGLESSPLRKIPVDQKGKMMTQELERQIQQDKDAGLSPWILCATAGTTNLGAIDPLQKCHEICRREKLWMHVDAAYGGFFWLTEQGRKRLQGMELGDSLVLDPHKGLFQPYGLGIVIVREGLLLKKSLSKRASYLQDLANDTVSSPMDYSPELTRHFRALRLWFSLKIHGMSAFRAALDEKMILASILFQEISRNSKLVPFSEPDLSVVAFRYCGENKEVSNQKTEKLLAKILERGRIHLSSTTLDGFLYLRLCVLSFRTHLEDIRVAIHEIENALSLL